MLITNNKLTFIKLINYFLSHNSVLIYYSLCFEMSKNHRKKGTYNINIISAFKSYNLL